MFDNDVLEVLKKNTEIYDFIRDLWINNFEGEGFGYLAENIFNEIPQSATFQNFKDRVEIILRDKEFKKTARKTRKAGQINTFQLDILKPYLANVESVLDFGCGKMSLLRQIAKEDLPQLKTLAGFDPKSNPEYTNFDNRSVFYSKIEDLKNQKFDMIVCSFVLHHLTNQEVEDSLEIIKSILNKNGKFILIEETFGQEIPSQTSISYLKKSNHEINLILTKRFLGMSREDRMKVLFINDVLINLKNLDYIPWTKNYKLQEEWKKIVESNDFRLKNQYFFGFILKGRLKQGITSMLEFTL